ncbi:hypothetical protein BOVMAS18_13820 [Streptococcus uberis]|uniref:DNA methyltransferase n=1 Tax=Streptococcus uberis TaxID=1349 RepID=UPI0019397CF4|nr:DNA methyltransferase [Streptococcus uberis]
MSEKKLKITEVEALPLETHKDASYIIKQNNPNNYTHGFFKYPCKFIPEIPRWAIKKYMPKNGKIVFDPFAGSGTTLLEAQIQGYDSYGTEIDPVAKKIINVKTQKYDSKIIEIIEQQYQKVIFDVENNESVVPFTPSINNLEHWFNEKNLKTLGKIKTSIETIEDEKAKSFLELILLSIIKSVSQADDSSPKPYVSKKIIKQAPDALEKFKATYIRYKKSLIDYSNLEISKNVKIVKGDALQTKGKFHADLAITSPPYINAFDYPRTLRLENLWMETHTEESILKSKSAYVGTERFKLDDERKSPIEILDESSLLKSKFESIKQIDEKRAFVVKKFFSDMKQNLLNVREHLADDGVYVIVIGNSTIRNEIIESWKILNDIAKNNGYEFVEHISYNILNPYIRIPRAGRGGKISQDHILVLRKVNG